MSATHNGTDSARPPARILMLEDSRLDADLALAHLETSGLSLDIHQAASREEFLAALDKCAAYDLILSDYDIPGFDGFQALAIARERCPHVPFIFVSGVLGEEHAIDSLRKGAADYVLKQRIGRLAPAVSRAIAESRERVERLRAEKALRESKAELLVAQERTDLVIAAAEVGLWYCDLPFDKLVWDRRVKAHFHLPPDAEVTIETFYERMHPDDRKRTEAAIAESVRTRRTYDIEYRTVSPDQTQIHWIRAIGATRTDESGVPRRFDGITIDITPQKTVEHEREVLLEKERSARIEIERASRIKDEFLTTLSHELRTPLNAILGWAQILRTSDRSDADDLAEGLQTIERNARAQTQIIEDLLDMSRIISGKMRLEVQQVDLAAVVRAAIDTVRPAAAAKGIAVQAILEASDVVISGDPNRLQQVLWNLLTNAVKFTRKGGRVHVRLELVDSHLKVTVADTGEGIESDFLPYVFDRFRQRDASTTRRHGGLGLGLAIAKQLVELHGGTIDAKSDGLGHGSTFVLRFPVSAMIESEPGQPSVRDRGPSLDGSASNDGNGDGSACTDIAGVKVLILDDEPDARALLRRFLEDCNAVVATAETAEQALQQLESFRPDVLISDIGMPGEDGYSLIRRVRRLDPKRGGNVPAIALTAYARMEDRVRSIATGFQMHVAKPVESKELITMVASLARRGVREDGYVRAD